MDTRDPRLWSPEWAEPLMSRPRSRLLSAQAHPVTDNSCLKETKVAFLMELHSAL